MKGVAVIGALAALLAASLGVGTSGATFTAHDEFTASTCGRRPTGSRRP